MGTADGTPSFEQDIKPPFRDSGRRADVPRLSNVFTLRTLDDSTALKDALTQSQRFLLLGAGFIGAEVAASARMMGREVLMVELIRQRRHADTRILSDATVDLLDLARA
jgi:pyruvate/2-oxoglutarate dehydrogenase complex dihydrolipoamide dehydrogenase (E3) component